MILTFSTPTLARLPPELRKKIFLDVVATSPWAKSLLVALRATHKDSSLYCEALQAYYHVRSCNISQGNAELVSKLGPWPKAMLRVLRIDFSVHQTTSSPVRFKRGFRYAIDLQGRIVAHETFYVPIRHTRILPRPAFDTIAPFANIQTLCLNAAAVIDSRFHQIEGMVKKAVQTCEKLQRVEVISDVASVVWKDAAQTDSAWDSTNYLWIARLNKGIGMTAKLKVVDSLGVFWPWFWEAPERMTLTWRD